MRPRAAVTERMTLVSLIERFADGLEVYDPFFARTLAAALHQRADQITLPVVEELNLSDVVVTFRMDKEMQLVITGNHHGGPGEVTLRYRESAFEDIEVSLHQAPKSEAYVFATLDHGWRGKEGLVTHTGERVQIRALTTVGAEIAWRVSAPSGSKQIGLESLTLVENE